MTIPFSSFNSLFNQRRRRRPYTTHIVWMGFVLPFLFWNMVVTIQEHNNVMTVLQQQAPTVATAETTTTTSTTMTTFDDDNSREWSSSSSSVNDNLLSNDDSSSARPTVDEIREASLVYAGTTYRYRYSTQRFQDYYRPIVLSSQNENDGGGDEELRQSQQRQRLPTIVFGVTAAANKAIKRDAIRSTWGKDVPIYFMVAGLWNSSSTNDNENRNRHNNNNLREKLTSEFNQHGDLLWLDTPEDYRNALTPKSFMLIHFVRNVLFTKNDDDGGRTRATFFGNDTGIDYVFKTDDDVFVNTTEMSVELDAMKWPHYFGMNSTGVPLRNASAIVGAKWVLTKEEYPRDDYPPYASGLGYALSTNSAFFERNNDCVTQTMAAMRHMPWEDVATGLLAEACQVPLSSADDFWTNGGQYPYLPFKPMEVYKDGGVVVKIMHKPRPHWYEPLMVQGSLAEANERFERQRKRMRQEQKRQRQQTQDKEQQQLQQPQAGKEHGQAKTAQASTNTRYY